MVGEISVGFVIGLMVACAFVIWLLVSAFSVQAVGRREEPRRPRQARRFSSEGEKAFHDLADQLYRDYTADGKPIFPRMWTSREEAALRRWAKAHPVDLPRCELDDLVERMERLTHPDDTVEGEWREVK